MRVATTVFVLLAAAACTGDRPTAPKPLTGAPAGVRADVAPPGALPGKVFGPATYTRSTGSPETDTASFTAPGGGTLTLHFTSGASQGLNATVTLNGVTVFTTTGGGGLPDSVVVAGARTNTLSAKLKGKPGSSLTVAVTAAVVVDPATGGTVATPDGSVSVTIPPGATASPLGVTTDAVVIDNTVPANKNVAGNAVDFGPEGTQFSVPVTITMQYDPARTPPLFSQAALRLGTLVNGTWVKVPGSTVDPTTHTVTGQTSHFSTYGVVAFGTFTQIAAGELHACGLAPTQDVYCWGSDQVGQLGSPAAATCTASSRPCTLTPALVAGGIKFVSIGAAQLHTCGIAVSGDAYCWGEGRVGVLGDGDTVSRAVPTLVSGGLHWASIALGYESTCGITTTGQTYCWGDNSNGEVGAPSSSMCATFAGQTPCALTPVEVVGPPSFTQVSVGLSNACGLATDHTAWCWGLGAEGAIGDGFLVNRSTPVAVAGGLLFNEVSAGGLSSCGVTATNVGYCWGTNVPYRILGIGDAPNSFVPIAVSGGLSMQAIVANSSNNIFEHNCAITTSDELWCWGGNDAQQLGSTVSNETCGTGTHWACQTVPTHVAPGVNFTSVAVGQELTCAIATDGNTYCMGNDVYGQIGDGTTSSNASWTRVPPP